MNWKAKLLYPQNWNIGFCEQTPEELIRDKKLYKIKWLKHPYRDRWFADPFIYQVTENEIVVFVEECMISDTPKGIICELVIDRKTMRLKKRYVMLELGTHLSYPAIVEKAGVTYVYPENGASGCLKMYRYDADKHQLVDPVCILNEAVADSTILYDKGYYYIIATLFENSQEKAFLYRSNNLFGQYEKLSSAPVQSKRICSRPAGNWILLKGRLLRPTQDCAKHYGSAINMMEVDSLDPYKESLLFSINPVGFNYNLGIHTINFSNSGELMVVDGYGYLHPVFSRIWNVWTRVKQSLLIK